MRVGMGYDVHKLVEGRKLIIGGVDIPYEKGLLGHSDADVLLFIIQNIDATIVAQAPKMRPYIDKMRENIADALSIDIGQVNVKATTEEGLGFTGNGEGISAYSICMLENPADFATMDMTDACRNCCANRS